jgi:hypothetical protein
MSRRLFSGRWFGLGFALGTGLVAAAALSLGLTGKAEAATFQASGVDIVNAAAQVHIVPENRNDIEAEIGPTGRLPAFTTSVVNGRLVIDGGLANRIHGCMSIAFFGPAKPTINIWGIGNVARESLPLVILHVPRQLDVNAGGAVFGDIGSTEGGHIHTSGCGHITLGSVNGALDAVLTGSGDLDVGAVSGALTSRLDGSGDLRVLAANGGVHTELIGSGDVTIGQMAGPLVARLDGSGDIRVHDGASGGDLDLRGSGDLNVGAIRGPLRAHVDGSGDLVVASLTGPQADLFLQGSGDLNVNGGAADHVGARLDGSGDLRFKGHAQSVDADLGGSGDISFTDAGPQRNVRDHGSGGVHFGN